MGRTVAQEGGFFRPVLACAGLDPPPLAYGIPSPLSPPCVGGGRERK